MIKRILIATMIYWTLPATACTNSFPPDDVRFCPSFKAAATCYCTSTGLPAFLCQDMNSLYNRMMLVFGSLKRACEYQHHTSTQDCVDNWTCYLRGGIDSRGRWCNLTQRAC